MQKMKIVLATGIYPPDIGGPATYVQNLVSELQKQGCEVIVITYARRKSEIKKPSTAMETGQKLKTRVICVGKRVPILRWFSYACALKKYAKDADIVYVFSSVSCGIPLWLARLKKPKNVLRLGGDFLWERYTDQGGRLGLREFYEKERVMWWIGCRCMAWLLNKFDHIIFSTVWQQKLYKKHYKNLPTHSCIENSLPPSPSLSYFDRSETYTFPLHKKHTPFRLLFMGRFVKFKNLKNLVKAVEMLDGVELTFVGDGPMKCTVQNIRHKILPPDYTEKGDFFADYDLLILPSLTEISSNVALEARASGMPVLLTEETGLSDALRQGMVVRPLKTPEQIRDALVYVMENYERIAQQTTTLCEARPWSKVCEEHVKLFRSFLNTNVSY